MSLRDNNKIYKIYNIFIFSFPFFLFFLSFFSLFFLKYIIIEKLMQQKPGYSRKASQNGACTAQYMVSSLPYHIFFEVWRKSCGVFAAKQFLWKVPLHTSPSVGCAPCRMRCSIWWLAVVMIMCCIGRRHSSWRGIIGSTFTCPWWFTG